MIIVFLFLNSSKTLLSLFFIFIFFRLFKNNRFKIYILALICLIIVSVISMNTKVHKNPITLENSIIKVDEILSLRVSRILNPCKWVEYRYFKSRTYYDMITKDSGFKHCPYSVDDSLSILPINFLNYSNEINTDYFIDDKSFKKIFIKFNNHIRSYNLDSFYAEYIYFNGIFFTFLSLLILINIIFILFKYSKEKNNLFLLILLIAYFVFHSGMYAPGNLIAIVFNLLIYRLLQNIQNEKIFNYHLHKK